VPLTSTGESAEFIRAILTQLTPETARKIAYENAQAMLANAKMKRRVNRSGLQEKKEGGF